MTRIYKFARYQISYFKTALMVYYATIVVLALFSNTPGSKNSTAASIVMIFVLGLNWFKPSYKFAQANNLTRKTFYYSTLLAILVYAGFMALVDIFLNSIFQHVKVDMYSQIYEPALGTQMLWSTILLIFMASLGWMISMIYYRANTKAKILISVSPVLISWAINFILNITSSGADERIIAFLQKAFGATGGVPNPYPAMFSFLIMSLAVWGINLLLMRKMPVKA